MNNWSRKQNEAPLSCWYRSTHPLTRDGSGPASTQLVPFRSYLLFQHHLSNGWWGSEELHSSSRRPPSIERLWPAPPPWCLSSWCSGHGRTSTSSSAWGRWRSCRRPTRGRPSISITIPCLLFCRDIDLAPPSTPPSSVVRISADSQTTPESCL